MSSVWISRTSWDKVWSALHNIRVRIDSRVRSPSAVISGNGTAARINIDLPAAGSNAQTVYHGPFALSFSEDDKKIIIAPGYANVNGEFFSVPEGSVNLSSVTKSGDGVLICLHIVKNTDTGKLETPEFRIAAPDAEHWPVGRIRYKDKSWSLDQFYTAVAVFLFAEECKFALIKGDLKV